MRIVYPVGAWFRDVAGGGYRVAYDLARAMARRGHDCHVVCPDVRRRGTGPERDGDVTVHRYAVGGHSSPDPRNLAMHVEGSRRAVEQLLGNAGDNAPTIVHGVTHLQMLGAMKAVRRARRPSALVMTFASPLVDEMAINLAGARGLRSRLLRWGALAWLARIERRILAAADVCHVMSRFCESRLSARHGTAWGARRLLASGWADARFHPIDRDAARMRLGWPGKVPIAVVVRRLVPRMGLELALAAVDLLRRRGRPVRLMIGGRGPLREALQADVRRRGLDEHVQFLDFIPDDELPLVYSAADANLVPSVSLECFGLTVVEAMSCGTPTVVTRVGALPELLENAYPEWVARDATGEGIADRLAAVLAVRCDERERRRIAEFTRRRFDGAAIVSRFEDKYRELVGARRCAGREIAASTPGVADRPIDLPLTHVPLSHQSGKDGRRNDCRG